VRAAAAHADRSKAVRDAGAGWRRAGAIDETQYRSIVALYPDDRARLGVGLRILAGLAALVGGGAFVALLGSLFGMSGGQTPIALTLALTFTLATEYQVGRLRRAQAGAEYSTAIVATACVAWAWGSVVNDPTVLLLSVEVSLCFAAAAWRWGYALFAAVGAIALLIASAQGTQGRATWFVLGLASPYLILRFARSSRWPPAQRRCFEAVGLVLLAAAYVSANVYSLDHRWIERFGETNAAPPGSGLRFAAIVGTIVIPPLILAVGARFRDHMLMAAGALFAAASLITLRRYHPLGPWWFSLVLGGIVCLMLAVGLRRWLQAGPGRERWGFTAEPLFEDRRGVRAAQMAATIVAMSPAARVAAGEHFEGGGGRSGGGGATGTD